MQAAISAWFGVSVVSGQLSVTQRWQVFLCLSGGRLPSLLGWHSLTQGLAKIILPRYNYKYNSTGVKCKQSAGVQSRSSAWVQLMRKPLHGQRKKDLTLTLTPEGVEMLDAKAKALGISKSEMIERIAREQVSSPLEHQLLGECCAN
ncbi:CopG family transcriptional regulator [Nostocaceae cyanobacterium CENA369]|uniref:CopG family transcriptional regulator n=2 Tax=Dendronalium TaxID=2840442 RepID=A0A8J7LH49_9NOST|nr:CopG family transcriptional regulator [Dendronalium phyllosphericum CENA369]